jgi:FAD/FMN-containing dehydrogenase
LIDAEDLARRFAERIADGFLYGDFQYSIDERSPDFMRHGVFSCYEPTDSTEAVGADKSLGGEDWLKLLRLAYTDRSQAFARYAEYYLSTNGQTYWSDTNQLSAYLPNYAQKVHSDVAGAGSTLSITEIYVPRAHLADFLKEAAQLVRRQESLVIYGTVRLIEKDEESFLAWAKQSYACVIFNLLVAHSPAGIQKAARTFRGLIDLAIARNGSYYLTYHRFASREQLSACYPQFEEFLKLKTKYDPATRFQSDWYLHNRRLFAAR